MKPATDTKPSYPTTPEGSVYPDRRVWKIDELEFTPFNRYGDEVAKLYWAPVTFDRATGKGCFIIRFLPGGTSTPHEHHGFEEFYVIEGSVIDHDGVEYKAGHFVSLKPGTKHYSHSPGGALMVAWLTDNNRVLEPGEAMSWGTPQGWAARSGEAMKKAG
jgi:quercetin dioxygenase-like cupin family protein